MRIQSQRTKILIRIFLVLFYFLMITLMFLFGRTHTVLVDNKAIDQFEAFDVIKIEFASGEPIELFKNERDKILLRGQKQKFKVSFTDGREDYVGTFKIALFEDCVLISIPGLVNGYKDSVQPFDLYSVSPPEPEDEPKQEE